MERWSGGKGKRSDRGEGPFHFLPLPRKRGAGGGRWGGGIAQPLCSAHPAVRALSRRPAASAKEGNCKVWPREEPREAPVLMRNLRARGGGGQREATAWLEGVRSHPSGRFCFKGRACGRCRIWARPVPCEGRRGCRRVCAPGAQGVRRAGWSRRWVFGSPGFGERGGGRDLPRTCAIYVCKG